MKNSSVPRPTPSSIRPNSARISRNQADVPTTSGAVLLTGPTNWCSYPLRSRSESEDATVSGRTGTVPTGNGASSAMNLWSGIHKQCLRHSKVSTSPPSGMAPNCSPCWPIDQTHIYTSVFPSYSSLFQYLPLKDINPQPAILRFRGVEGGMEKVGEERTGKIKVGSDNWWVGHIILGCMRQSRQSLNAEVREMRSGKGENALGSWEGIVAKQQTVIRSLQEEILLLKSYISLDRSVLPNEPSCSEISLSNTSCSSIETPASRDTEESSSALLRHYESVFKQIADLLGLKPTDCPEEHSVIQALTKLRESASRKNEPIFIERVKEIKVPITVQKIVEKPVERIIEKIVYIQRQSNNQKVNDRVPQRREKEEEPTLNKTYSEKNLRKKDRDAGYYEDRTYDNSRNTYESEFTRREGREGNSGLVKKRQDPRKYGGFKANY